MRDLAGKGNKTKLILHENFYSRATDPLELSKLVIKEGTPLKPLIETLGVIAITSIIAAMIDGYCQQFNISKNMTQRQIEDLALDLCLNFKVRKGNSVMLEELAVFFDRAGKGEFSRNGKKLVPFDRIDRQIIEDMMDVYFEEERTAAIWALHDEREALKRGTIEDTPRLTDAPEAAPLPFKDIYLNMAGEGPKFALAKLMNELHQKYGDADQAINEIA